MPQSLANLLVHVIFSTKERRPLIDDAGRAGLHGYMAGVLKKIESPALIINSVLDHVHVLCAMSKNIADRKSTRLNSSHPQQSRMPSSA